MAVLLEKVFGVSANPVLSYVQRASVDDSFESALRADKELVVYGSSKQGKTALVQRYLPYEHQIVVRLTPKTEIEDIYRSILRQAGIEIRESTTISNTGETGAAVKAGFKALIPFVGGASASGEVLTKDTAGSQINYKEISFRLGTKLDAALQRSPWHL